MKKLIGGGIFLFVGAFFLLGFVLNITEKGAAPDSGDAAALVLFVIIPMLLGGFMIRSHYKNRQMGIEQRSKAVQNKREKQVIRLAQKHGGRLTIPEIAVDTSMTTEDAEAFMRELTSKGYVNMEVTDSGVIVYEFYEIAHRGTLPE